MLTHHFTGIGCRVQQTIEGVAPCSQDLRPPDVPCEESRGRGGDPVFVPPVQSGDVLLPRAPRRALASAHELLQGAAAEMRPPGVQEASGNQVRQVHGGIVLQ